MYKVLLEYALCQQKYGAQLLDLLQLSRAENEYKALCRNAIRGARSLRACRTLWPWAGLLWADRMVKRRQAVRAARRYLHMRKNRMAVFRDYIDRLPVRTHKTGTYPNLTKTYVGE